MGALFPVGLEAVASLTVFTCGKEAFREEGHCSCYSWFRPPHTYLELCFFFFFFCCAANAYLCVQEVCFSSTSAALQQCGPFPVRVRELLSCLSGSQMHSAGARRFYSSYCAFTELGSFPRSCSVCITHVIRPQELPILLFFFTHCRYFNGGLA